MMSAILKDYLGCLFHTNEIIGERYIILLYLFAGLYKDAMPNPALDARLSSRLKTRQLTLLIHLDDRRSSCGRRKRPT